MRDLEKFLHMVGWHDGAGAATHDPIPNNEGQFSIPSTEDVDQCLCIMCEKPLITGSEGKGVLTVSIMWNEGFARSYFYRVHRKCIPEAELISPRGCNVSDDKAWTMIEQHAMENPSKGVN